MTGPTRVVCLLAVLAMAAGCTDSKDDDRTATAAPPLTRVASASPLLDRPLPPPVTFRDTPDGTSLADPAFEALPGARAEFGQLGGSVYQIEVPDHWNGRLVLWMHGFAEFAPEASTGAPDFRHFLIANGTAWGASSFSSTSLIPGRAADETAALWDHFVREHRRPERTYVVGMSMGGWAAHIAAERYGNRFDGALGLCGAAGTVPGVRIPAEMLVAGAYVAGVTQAEFDAAPDVGAFVTSRIRRAIDEPEARERFENIMVDLTGGARAFDREGFRDEEETNWERAVLLVTGRVTPPRDARYLFAPGSEVDSADFNRRALRLPSDDEAVRTFTDGFEVTGDLRMPLLTMHTTGDGQVPIDQAQILRQRVASAGKSDLLVQRVVEDPGHCGFTTSEEEASLDALFRWVEQDRRPDGTDLSVTDLTRLDRTFELQPRPGARGADHVPGAEARVVVSGRATVDGAPFDARFLGAAVRSEGLLTPCQYTLPRVEDGRYEITVLAEAEAAGCGRRGAEVLLWTFVDDTQLYSTEPLAWPRGTTVSFDATFSTAEPRGVAPSTTEFSGEVYRPDGLHVRAGARVEAYVGDTRCGVASTRSTGSFNGYSLDVVGPDEVPGCDAGGRLTFRVDGRSAVETSVNSPDHSGSLDLTVR